MTPIKASRALSALEDKLEAGAAPPPKKNGPAEKVTQAPPPGRIVSGRGDIAPDEVTRAIDSDDTGAYIEAMNRREMARRKGQ